MIPRRTPFIDTRLSRAVVQRYDGFVMRRESLADSIMRRWQGIESFYPFGAMPLLRLPNESGGVSMPSTGGARPVVQGRIARKPEDTPPTPPTSPRPVVSPSRRGLARKAIRGVPLGSPPPAPDIRGGEASALPLIQRKMRPFTPLNITQSDTPLTPIQRAFSGLSGERADIQPMPLAIARTATPTTDSGGIVIQRRVREGVARAGKIPLAVGATPMRRGVVMRASGAGLMSDASSIMRLGDGVGASVPDVGGMSPLFAPSSPSVSSMPTSSMPTSSLPLASLQRQSVKPRSTARSALGTQHLAPSTLPTIQRRARPVLAGGDLPLNVAPMRGGVVARRIDGGFDARQPISASTTSTHSAPLSSMPLQRQRATALSNEENTLITRGQRPPSSLITLPTIQRRINRGTIGGTHMPLSVMPMMGERVSRLADSVRANPVTGGMSDVSATSPYSAPLSPMPLQRQRATVVSNGENRLITRGQRPPSSLITLPLIQRRINRATIPGTTMPLGVTPMMGERVSRLVDTGIMGNRVTGGMRDASATSPYSAPLSPMPLQRQRATVVSNGENTLITRGQRPPSSLVTLPLIQRRINRATIAGTHMPLSVMPMMGERVSRLADSVRGNPVTGTISDASATSPYSAPLPSMPLQRQRATILSTPRSALSTQDSALSTLPLIQRRINRATIAGTSMPLGITRMMSERVSRLVDTGIMGNRVTGGMGEASAPLSPMPLQRQRATIVSNGENTVTPRGQRPPSSLITLPLIQRRINRGTVPGTTMPLGVTPMMSERVSRLVDTGIIGNRVTGVMSEASAPLPSMPLQRQRATVLSSAENRLITRGQRPPSSLITLPLIQRRINRGTVPGTSMPLGVTPMIGGMASPSSIAMSSAAMPLQRQRAIGTQSLSLIQRVPSSLVTRDSSLMQRALGTARVAPSSRITRDSALIQRASGTTRNTLSTQHSAPSTSQSVPTVIHRQPLVMPGIQVKPFVSMSRIIARAADVPTADIQTPTPVYPVPGGRLPQAPLAAMMGQPAPLSIARGRVMRAADIPREVTNPQPAAPLVPRFAAPLPIAKPIARQPHNGDSMIHRASDSPKPPQGSAWFQHVTGKPGIQRQADTNGMDDASNGTHEEQLVNKVLEKFMRILHTEQDRRGGKQWR